MTTSRLGSRLQSIVLPGLLLLAVACGGGGGSSGALDPAGPGSGSTLTTAVEVLPVQPSSGSDFNAVIGYAIAPATAQLGAYVAEITFDPQLVQYVSTDPAIGEGRVVNTTEAASGKIVVAGASYGGFTDGLLLKGTFRALSPTVTAANFSVTVREATDNRLGNLLVTTR